MATQQPAQRRDRYSEIAPVSTQPTTRCSSSNANSKATAQLHAALADAVHVQPSVPDMAPCVLQAMKGVSTSGHR
eukprot:1095631-Pleurochrysis_carterae.AAC.1